MQLIIPFIPEYTYPNSRLLVASHRIVQRPAADRVTLLTRVLGRNISQAVLNSRIEEIRPSGVKLKRLRVDVSGCRL